MSPGNDVLRGISSTWQEMSVKHVIITPNVPCEVG